jgi:hypothetical protein
MTALPIRKIRGAENDAGTNFSWINKFTGDTSVVQ